MAKNLTKQDVAELILDILVKDLASQPGNLVPDQALRNEYRKRGGDSADIKIGLKYAAEKEWLTYDRSKDAWYLTELGYKYP